MLETSKGVKVCGGLAIARFFARNHATFYGKDAAEGKTYIFTIIAILASEID